MTPRREPELTEFDSAKPAPATAAQLEGFKQRVYDNRPPLGEDVALSLFDPMGSALATAREAAGEALNQSQRYQLTQGLLLLPPSSIPHTNAAAHNHPRLKKMIDVSDPSQAHELGQVWNALGNVMMVFGASLLNTANSSEAHWVGQAGNAARAALSELASWSHQTGQGAQFMATTVRTQAEAAEIAKNTMPEPVPYDPASYQAQLNATNNPAEWVRIMGDARDHADKQNDAYTEAKRVVETYSASLRETDATMPAFTPPPRFGDGDTGHPPYGRTPGGRGAAVLPPAGGTGGQTPGGSAPERPLRLADGHDSPSAVGTDATGYGGGGVPPASTVAQSVSYSPEIPGGVPAGGRGGESGGLSFLPATAPVIDAARLGRNPGASVRFGPRGSGTPNLRPWDPRTSNARPWDPRIPNSEGNLRGRDSGAENRSGPPPTPPAGTAQRGEDVEHRHPSYLVETEDIWGDGRHVAPPVIGEDPPEYYY